MDSDDVLRLLRQRIAEAGTKYRFCIENDVHQGTLCKVLKGEKKIEPQILVALGLRRVVSYEPK